MMIRIVVGLVGLTLLLPALVWLEDWAIEQWWRYAVFAVGITGAWLEQRRRGRESELEQSGLSFEERTATEFEFLNLA